MKSLRVCVCVCVGGCLSRWLNFEILLKIKKKMWKKKIILHWSKLKVFADERSNVVKIKISHLDCV